MSLNILKYPNEILTTPSIEIQEITPELKSFAKEMVKTMYLAEGIGLAAPQVGRNIRLIVVDVSRVEEDRGLKIFFNPLLTPIEDAGFVEGEEGCLSVDDYRSKVKRYAKVFLEAIDENNKKVSLEAEGILSICLQHEVDHLNGVLFIDRISRLKRKFYKNKLKKNKETD